MKELIEHIKNDGHVLGKGTLRVDNFITHQVGPGLMEAMGNRFAEVFAEVDTTRVATIEASGIAPALYTAQKLGVSMTLARKVKSLTMDEELLTAPACSFTKQVTSQIFISRKFLSDADKVLIINDLLANGQTAKGLIELCRQADAKIEGIGIVTEKSLQDGHQLLGDMGLSIASLACIVSLSEGTVMFLGENAQSRKQNN